MRTRELFWKRALDTFELEDAVAWALKELENSPVKPALSSLAGLVKPFNAFEIDTLLRDALQELGLVEPGPEAGYQDFICSHVSDVLAGRMSEFEACERLAAPYRVDLSRRELQPFWLLRWAVKDQREANTMTCASRATTLGNSSESKPKSWADGFCRGHRPHAD